MKRNLCMVLLLCLGSLIGSVFESEAQDIELLIKKLGDKEVFVRLNAAFALKEIGTPEAMKAVAEYEQ